MKSESNKSSYSAGEQVTILKIPDSLVHDLPEDERAEIRQCEGKTLTIEKIDSNGFLWFGVGSSQELKDRTHYSGHSFCLEPKHVQRLEA